MLLYKFIKMVLSLALDVFFDDIETRHTENIPGEGPVIFAANHPSSIMDALIIGTKIPRKINYIGHSGLFSSPIQSKFFRSMGVIPVYRKLDNPDKMDKNVQTFQACYDTLANGECIGIFPEGTSQTDRKVLKLKTGTARIALGAEKENDYSLGVKIIPLGLYFTNRQRFRSNVLLNFGRPIEVNEYRELAENDEIEAVHRLTDRVAEDLGKLTLNIRKDELNSFVRDLDRIYKSDLMEDLEDADLLPEDDEVFKEMFLTQQIADAVDYYIEKSPETVGSMMREVSLYRKKIDRFRLRDSMLKGDIKRAKVTGRGGKVAFWSVAGLPIWIAGVVTNYVPYKFSEYIGERIGYEETKTSSALFIGGGLAFILYYAIQTYIVWSLFNPLTGIIFLVSLPFLGFGALAYRRKIRQRWSMWNFSLLLLTNRHIVRRLKLERRSLIRRLNEFKDDYMKVIGQADDNGIV